MGEIVVYCSCLRTTRRTDMMVYEVKVANNVTGRTKVLRVDAESCMDAHRKALLSMGSFGHWTILNSCLVAVNY